MKSTAVLVAVLGSSAVTALQSQIVKPATTTPEVIITRTVTVTTFKEARPTGGKFSADGALYGIKGSGRKGPPGRRPSASPLETLPGFDDVAHNIPQPTKKAMKARGPMPMVVIPTLPAISKVAMPVPNNGSTHEHHDEHSGHRHGTKVHNGTFDHHHVNHTGNHGKGKLHHEVKGLKEGLNKVEDFASAKANKAVDSALSKAQNLLNEMIPEDTAHAS